MRLKAMLVTAAALIGGGAAVGVALWDAGQQLDPPMTCGEWAKHVKRVSGRQEQRTYYVAAQTGVNPPKAYGDRVLGACGASVCVVDMQGCPAQYSYRYKILATVSGWRLGRITAHPYIAGGHKAWADGTAGARWLGSWGEVVDACLALLSASECQTLLAGASDCWLLGNGNTCRNGREYGPGLGGTTACAPGAGAKPMPCTVNRGAGSEIDDVQRTWTDAELDL